MRTLVRNILDGAEVGRVISEASKNEVQVRTILSKDVINKIADGSQQNIIRRIIFDKNTRIDWDRAFEIIKDEMPELNKKKKEKSPYYDKIKEVFAVYTGGGIWLFYGQLTDGNYFLTDDYGATLFLDADPSDLEFSTYPEWQDEHNVKELSGEAQLDFCDALCDKLQDSDTKHRGGMSNLEISHYRDYFKAT